MKYPDYRGDEPCAELGVDTFYIDDRAGTPMRVINLIKDMCSSCHIHDECFEWAIRHESHGFWAGTTPNERIRIRNRRGIILESPEYWVWITRDRTAS